MFHLIYYVTCNERKGPVMSKNIRTPAVDHLFEAILT